jgi:hypothetical protein
MSGFAPQWALCGGWAVDAWFGRETRKHLDVDVAVFHDDQFAVYNHMAGWELIGHDDEVAEDSKESWHGRQLVLPAHIHAHAHDGFELEFHLNERIDGAWVFSREPPVFMPLAECVRPSRWGVPAVVPEVILFYKALPPGWRGSRPELRPHDHSDFSLLLRLLNKAQRGWVAHAISSIDARHPWLPQLV